MDGLYLGKVILNSDISEEGNNRPLGRVKVLINGVTQVDIGTKRDQYKYPLGSNIASTASAKTIQNVKNYEVWAYVLQPIAGSGTMGKFNAKSGTTVVSDSDYPDDPSLSVPPAGLFPLEVTDSFTDNNNGSAGINPNAHAYTPDNRSNASKGIFAVPAVGSTVLVGFINGSRGMPIVLGTVMGYTDIGSIYESDSEGVYPSYPYAYSNVDE
jgi:hypothetical protein